MGKVLTQLPIVVDAEILSACGRLGIPDEPVFVEITPDPAARVNKCVYNVDAAFSAGRGTAVLGWKIHIWPGVLVEFVGHAVLLSGGLLRCVTPDRYGDTKILFATDPRLSFDLQDPMARMPTRRIASTEHEDVAAFIRTEDEMNAIRRTHRPRPGEVLITGTDADRFRRLERAQRRAFRDISLRTVPLNGPCVCERGRPFKKCCRPGMLQERDRDNAV